MAQPIRFSRLAGGQIRDGSRGSRSIWTQFRAAPWESMAILLAFVSLAYIASMVISEGILDGLLPQDRQRVVVTAHFAECSGPARVTCVVDGDTIWLHGTKIRLADIDTPEVSSPSCTHELALGQRATARLTELLNAGPLDLESYKRDKDIYGRSLRIVSRNGASLGNVLVREGLARVWDGSRHSWCG